MLRDPALAPLSRQHHNGLALCVLTERSLKGEASPETVARLAAQAAGRWDLEIANHFAIEEDVVFPAVVREFGPQALIDELLAEHHQLERFVEQLRAAPDAAFLREFIELLRKHIRREENELFEDVQRRLPRKILDALGVEIDARAVCIPL
ncbi:MAG: hemerythrin domain-containing protein [Bryobacterales bacterium]|nr:hemerythrin domain-containing protein [Bryobacterales bacterium]